MKIDLDKIWTVKEFADEFGYSEEYVRQCCREQSDFRTGKPLSLPKGWKARKIGRDWLIFPSDANAIRKLRRKRQPIVK